MSETEATHNGACRCGQVQLKVRGKPLITMACHCSGCQKMTSSAFSLSALYPLDVVDISGLEPVIGGMHGEMRHHFCPHCLSWMFTRAEMMGPLVNIRSSMLDNVAELAPFIETGTREKLEWAQTSAVHSYAMFAPKEDFPMLMQAYAQSIIG
ncbi:GFA family protein [Rhizobium sp. CG5]|uniref:GFA family protein n=1 Tax=Rhizobium sp. CG5 TaxID=2726076 RepID=UPI002034949C|nr:GFA family protein [Rhizobium sp. CG5]MCM2474911.1 GFA family protein [Rhizobium sp. CG5]